LAALPEQSAAADVEVGNGVWDGVGVGAGVTAGVAVTATVGVASGVGAVVTSGVGVGVSTTTIGVGLLDPQAASNRLAAAATARIRIGPRLS
jgi:hypothetical protein